MASIAVAAPAPVSVDWTPTRLAVAASAICVLAGIVAGCLHALARPVEPLAWALAVVLITACTAVAVHQMRAGQAFAPSAIYAYLFALHFGLPGLLVASGQYEWEYEANRHVLTVSMVYVLLAWLAFQVGHRLVSDAMAPRAAREPAPDAGWSADRVLLACLAMTAVGFAIRVHIVQAGAYFQLARVSQGELEGPLFALVRMIELFPMYALCIAAIARWSEGTARDVRIVRLFWILLALEALYWLPTGRKEQTILVFLLPLIVRYLLTGRFLRLPGIVASALVLAVFFPLVHYYRVGLELGVFDDGNVIDTLSAGARLLDESASHSELSPFEVVLNRLSLIESLTACVRLIDTLEWRPFWGQSYTDFIVGLVPRVLWPDKPEFHYGTEFGRAAGMLGADDWLTSISVTFPGEAYLNFGWGGALAMAGIGAVFAALYRLRSVSRHPQAWLLMYVVALPSVLYVGGTFALHFGGLAKLLPALFVLAMLLRAPPVVPSRIEPCAASSA